MKFQCHSCSAKYSISDDKITKEKFRIRCKRCDQMVIVTTEAQQSLRGQRNENSVLFSARDLPGVSATFVAQAEPAETPGNEGSGLLDIRGLAATYGSHGAGEASTGNAPRAVIADDGSGPIPSLVTDDRYTPPGLVLPVLAQTPEPRNRLVWALGGIAGALAIMAIMLAIIIIKNDDRAKSYADAPTNNEPALLAQAENPASGEVTSAETAVEQSSTGEVSDSTGSTGSTESVGNESSENPAGHAESTVAVASETSSQRRDRRRRRDRQNQQADNSTSSNINSSTSSSGTDDSTSSTTASKEEPPAQCKDEVACLLADFKPACCKRFKDPYARDRTDRSDARSDLPERPSRSAIKSAIAGVRDRVKACGQRHPARGQVTISLKVGSNGRVTRSTVKDSPDPALGRCVATAMRSARFAESKSGVSFKYPFTF